MTTSINPFLTKDKLLEFRQWAFCIICRSLFLFRYFAYFRYYKENIDIDICSIFVKVRAVYDEQNKFGLA